MARPNPIEEGSVHSLATLHLDVLLDIAAHLDITSLARLGQTCRQLADFVEKNGWREYCLRRSVNTTRVQILSGNDSVDTGKERLQCKQALQLDRAWARKSFRISQVPLPIATTSIGTGYGVKKERHPALPSLLLTPTGLYLFTGSEMRLWTARSLQATQAIQLEQAQLFRLTNPANLDLRWDGSKARPRQEHDSSSSALWDICACTRLDQSGSRLAIGRLNGLIEIIELSKGAGDGNHIDTMKVNLAWICRDFQMAGVSIQAMHASPKSNLLAIAAKDGTIVLFRISSKRVQNRRTLQVKLVDQWSIGCRPWSIWVQGNKWLTIGINADEPILVYALDHKTSRATKVCRLGLERPHKTSVYAMQGSRDADGREHLLAGCFDGVLRRYDMLAVLSRSPSLSAVRPVWHNRDRFDPSPIYCILDGVDQGGSAVACGTARHGICKFYQTTSPQVEEESWSLFAADQSHS